MKKVVKKQSRAIPILLTIAAVIFVIFVLLPVTFALFDGDKMGNVAIIPIEGIITANGASYLGGNTISSQDIVSFIEDADAKSQIKIIVLEINSPGGSPVASDEIAVAIKRTEKPVIDDGGVVNPANTILDVSVQPDLTPKVLMALTR